MFLWGAQKTWKSCNLPGRAGGAWAGGTFTTKPQINLLIHMGLF